MDEDSEHDLADSALGVMLAAASGFRGDADGNLTAEEREALWEVADAAHAEKESLQGWLPGTASNGAAKPRLGLSTTPTTTTTNEDVLLRIVRH